MRRVAKALIYMDWSVRERATAKALPQRTLRKNAKVAKENEQRQGLYRRGR